MPRLNNLPDLKSVRRQLRARATPAEQLLWSALQRRQLAGRKFRRQHSVLNWVLDFYCPAERLAVELDGSPHDAAVAQSRDESRDAQLARLGIRVLRYENRDVMENLEGVVRDIEGHFRRD